VTHRIVIAVALAAAAAPPLAGQADGWDSERALELVRHAQERRQVALADTGLVDYRADARGWVYFYLDRRDTGERTLVKTDQVALEVMWRAPDLARQRIVGLRDARNLPTNIQYHDDHLSVVLDNFGDLIRLGDGDEVADVLHPAAPRAPATYEYRLADSTTIRLPGAAESVRVYKLQVRPRDRGAPALVGTMFVDRRMGDIVRMEFTFTPVSYVDPQLDYINVLLENGLHKGRFWLPDRQQVELRRELRELNLPAAGMIRGTMRIGNYRFNQGIPEREFAGPRLVTVPVEQRRAFPFEEAIDAELREVGLTGAVELGEIRREAARLMGRQLLSGLPAGRLALASATSALRYNRAEGLAIGAGLRALPAERTGVVARGGLATATRRPFAEVEAWRGERPDRTSLALYRDRPGDAGSAGPVVSGAMNTLTALIAGYDFTDPYRASGGELRVERGIGRGWALGVRPRVERHASAALLSRFSLLGGDGHFRPVHPVEEGVWSGGTVELRRELPAELGRGWGVAAEVEAARLRADAGEERRYARPTISGEYVLRGAPAAAELLLSARAGAVAGEAPVQSRPRIGGRGTVPGHAFREWGGGTYAFGQTTLSVELVPVLLRGRFLAAGGYAGAGPLPTVPPPGSLPRPAGRSGTLFSIGTGIGVLYDILRFDLVRGLGRGGRWEVIIEASPAFWDFL
jgi:hypothetical protein